VADITPTGFYQYNTWQTWNLGTTTASTTNLTTWQYWNNSPFISSSTTTLSIVPAWGAWNTDYEETQEQRLERERFQAEQAAERERVRVASAARYEEQRQQRIVVQTRARELLLSLLTEEQAVSYTEQGWFEVRGSRGGRWRIRDRGQAGNVDLMPEIGDIREASFCCHPPGGLPDADAHVAQMLHLVTDEDGFRRTANLIPGRAA